MLQLSPMLQSLVRKLWDRFWSGGTSNRLSAIAAARPEAPRHVKRSQTLKINLE